MLEYKSPTTMEMPEVETFLVEDPDPNGPFGAKEVGQGPLLPIPPAVANAVFDAVGVRVDEVPVTPEKVLAALKAKAQGKPARFGPTRFPDVPYPAPIHVPTPAEGGDGRAVGRGGDGSRGSAVRRDAMMRLPKFRYFAPRRVEEALASWRARGPTPRASPAGRTSTRT